MSFRFTVLPDERFVEILEAWADSAWPKTIEDGYALRDRFGWVPDGIDPALFTSDVEPDEPSAYFGARNGSITSLTLPLTDTAPKEAWSSVPHSGVTVWWSARLICVRSPCERAGWRACGCRCVAGDSRGWEGARVW